MGDIAYVLEVKLAVGQVGRRTLVEDQIVDHLSKGKRATVFRLDAKVKDVAERVSQLDWIWHPSLNKRLVGLGGIGDLETSQEGGGGEEVT